MPLYDQLTIAALLQSLLFALLLAYAAFVEEKNLLTELNEKHIIAIALAISVGLLAVMFKYKTCEGRCLYRDAYWIPSAFSLVWCCAYLSSDLIDELGKVDSYFAEISSKYYFTGVTLFLITLIFLNLVY